MIAMTAVAPDALPIADDRTLDTLTGEAVTLSPLQESDVFAHADHEQLAQTVTWEAYRTPGDPRSIRELCSRRSLARGHTLLAWAARERRDGRVLGHVMFTEQGEIRGQLGFVFHYEHWRRRLPVEALRLAIDGLFTHLPRFERIEGLCLPNHREACELLEHVGMPFEGVERSMLRVHGEVVDLACYAITRKDWLHRRAEWQPGAVDLLDEGHI